MDARRILDLLTDPRLPHCLPKALWRRYAFRRRSRSKPVIDKLHVLLTVDVEQDNGRQGPKYDAGMCGPFLERFSEICRVEGWRTTLFVQGAIVEQLGPQLRYLEPDHELGLHGYYHELWGSPRWYMRGQTMDIESRRTCLALGLHGFRRAGLSRPLSFRAPWLIADQATLRLIQEAGFTIDSSLPSYRGILPVPYQEGHLTRIPVTASPTPFLIKRGHFPVFTPYCILNLQNFVLSDEAKILTVLAEVFAYQISKQVIPHIVIFMHPWEFYSSPADGFASEANFDRLVRRLQWLQTLWNLEYQTMQSFQRALRLNGLF